MKKTKPTKQGTDKKMFSGKHLQVLYLVILSCLFLSNYSRIFDEKLDMNGDNIVYYSLGKAINEGKGFVNTIGYDETPHTHFPPGYPYFVAFVMKIVPDSVKAVKTTNGVLLYLSMILLFYVLYAMCENKLISFAVTALAVSQITILRFATIMMSEMLFLFFSLIIILIALKYKPSQAFTKSQKRWYDILIICLLLFSIGYLNFIRTMGLSLILAVIFYYGILTIQKLYFYLKNLKQRKESNEQLKEHKMVLLKYAAICLLVFLSFFVPKLMWDARNSSVGKTSSDYVGDFHKKQNGLTMQTFDDWKERVVNNVQIYTTKWLPSAIFSNTPAFEDKYSVGWWKGIIIILLILFGFYKFRKGALLLFLYLFITMGVLMVWPEQYGGQRYMLSIIPFIIFLFICGCNELLKLLFSKLWKKQKDKYLRFTPVLVLALFILIAYPSYSKSIKEAELLAKFKDYTTANAAPPLAEFLDAIRWTKVNIQDTGRMSTRKPELYYMYSGGRQSISFPNYATPEEIFDYFKQNRIRYVIIDRWFRHAYVTVIPAVQKYHYNFKIIHQIGGTEPNTPPTYVLEFNPDWGYTGGMLNGMKHGTGKFIMQDGRTYSGEFINDMCNGYGVMTDTQGNIMAKGIWKDNVLVKPD